MNTATPDPKRDLPEVQDDPSDPPSGKLLAQVQEHAEAFVDGLIDYGQDKIIMAKVSVEFANGTTLKYTRDDFGYATLVEDENDDADEEDDDD